MSGNLKTFYGIEILLRFVWNTAKDVDEFVLECATWVIMTTSVHLSESDPFVWYSIVDFSLFASTVDIFTRSGNHDVVLTERTARVTMARKAHLSFLLKLVLTNCTWNSYDLLHLEHRVRELIEVTTSTNIYSCVLKTNLNSLEVVREVCGCLNCVDRHNLSLCIVDIELLWILLSYIYLQIRVDCWHTWCKWILNCCLSTCIAHNLLNCLWYGLALFITVAGRCMLEDLIVCTLHWLAFRALENQFFEHFFDHAMNIGEIFCSHALFALPFTILCNELLVAVVTIDTVALWTLFRLPYYELADATNEMVDSVREFRRHELLRLYVSQ